MDAGSLIGFIGDIHGDLDALKWALDALQDAERVVSLGDVVDGRYDLECIALLQTRGVTVVQGNHDAWASTEDRHLDDAIRSWLGGLPRCLEESEWLAWHSYHVDVGSRFPTWEYLMNERIIREALASRPQQVLFSGHTHVAGVNVLEEDRLRYINTETLRTSPRVVLEADKRYTVAAGRPTECVVLYDRRSHVVEYRFREEKVRPEPPQPSGLAALWEWLSRQNRRGN
ncbi:MAG: metallophosphoesterase family protein [Candidatus Xenobia bacterium]